MRDLTIIKTEEITGDCTLALAGELYREGRLGEAREVLAGRADFESALLLSKVEHAAKDSRAALAALSEPPDNPRDRARFHTMRAAVLLLWWELTGDARLSGRAFVEYEAAAFEWDAAGDEEGAGYVENNLAYHLARFGRFDDARAHLAKARAHFAGMPVKLAEVDETEAQNCLAEGEPAEALHLALNACATFEAHGERRLLLEALPTLQKAAADYQHSGASLREVKRA